MLSRALGLATVVVAATMDLLDGTVLNTVLPRIQQELVVGDTATSWIATVYTLLLGIGLTIGGRLGDRFGHRRMLLTGTIGFGLASLLCALAPGAGTLIAGRAAQGAASALMVPQVLALIQLLYPAERRARALGVFAAVAGVATVSGPVAGAVLTELDVLGLGWRLVFLINLPMAVFVVIGAATLPAPIARASAGVDWPGVALLAAGLVAALVPLLGAADGSWTAASTLSVVLAAAVLAWFAVLERRRAGRQRPVLVDPVLLGAPGFLGALAVSAAIYAAVFGLFFTLSLFLQAGLGWSPLHAALTVLPWALGILVANTVASRTLVPRHGRRVLEGGVAVLLVGLSALTTIISVTGTTLSSAAMLAPLLVSGIGMGLVVAPVLTLGLAEVPTDLAGSASGLINNTQQLAGAFGIAVTAPIYFAGTADELTPTLLAVLAMAAVAGPATTTLPRSARPGSH